MLREKWVTTNLLASALALLFLGTVHAAVEKGPYLIYDGVNTEMTVLWQLDTSQSCTIDWGQDVLYSGGGDDTTEYGSDHQHKYTITGLTPGAKYFYQVGCNSDNVGSGSFYAAPANDVDNVKILAYGDTRTYPADHDSVSAQMSNTYTIDQGYQTIALHVGDWVNNGDVEDDWAYQFFDPSYISTTEFQANMPLNGCKGNHEGSGDLFYKYFPYLYETGGFYWSFDYGPAHITVIDQYVDYSPGSTQYTWLENDLASSAKKWKFLVFHEPGWSAGGHSNEAAVQVYIQPLAVEHGVDVIFAGHNHYYARAVVDGIHHVTTGGGGAPLYAPDPSAENIVVSAASHHFCEVDIQGDDLYFTARDKYGVEIDSFQMNDNIPLPPPPPQDGVINVRVGQSMDDVEESLADGSMYSNSSDLEFGYDSYVSSEQALGLRFVNVAIPQGATITSAYLQFTVDETASTQTTAEIRAESADSAAGFTVGNYDVTNRTTTSSVVNWSVPAWNTVGDLQQSPDISSLVQEVVDRGGWNPGGNMVFVIHSTGDRTAESYDGLPASAPLLHVEFETGTTPPANNLPVATLLEFFF